MKTKQLIRLCPFADYLASVVVLAIAVSGCHSKQEGNPLAFGQSRMNTGTRIEPPVGGAPPVRVILSHEPQAFTFQTEGLASQTNLQAFIASLKAKGIKEVALDSRIKLAAETERGYMDTFTTSGVHVSEFWLPTMSRPGRVNLLSK